jgi:SAM-dependent MidA family methyltransferase
VGGGTGRLARDVLDHVRAAAPGVHARMRYTCVEISARLAGMQRATLGAGGAHAGRFSVRAATGPWAGQGLAAAAGVHARAGSRSA